jgi:2-polyprenyl-3-methyl-5-hydroxy-6-metoxy-1,4-benzoquinol methylase
MENKSNRAVNLSKKNAEFWNELCGSHLAEFLGIKDASPKSLKRFDDWFFDFYPYLNNYIQFKSLYKKNVLEVGLGYGSVSEKIASSGAFYQGLDIALGPVNMVNHRLTQNRLAGGAIQGSILESPFENKSFDAIVTIGCLHHTGNLKGAIAECHRLLKPGGRLIFMTYYAYSYRRWTQAPITTFRYLINEIFGLRNVVGASSIRQRSSYDKNKSGDGAPHTDWISKKSLAALCSNFSKASFHLENIDSFPFFRRWSRSQLLASSIPKYMGLDLYVVLTK